MDTRSVLWDKHGNNDATDQEYRWRRDIPHHTTTSWWQQQPDQHVDHHCSDLLITMLTTHFMIAIQLIDLPAVIWHCFLWNVIHCQARKLNREDAMDRSRHRKLIKDGWWSGQVWVGECVFWCRLTQLVPDKYLSVVKCWSSPFWPMHHSFEKKTITITYQISTVNSESG